MTVKFIPPKPAEIIPLDQDDTPKFTETLDCQHGVSEDELKAFLKRFCIDYWSLDEDGFRPELDLIDDVEREWLAKWDQVPLEEVEYGRIGTRNGEGGISDRGLASFLFLQDLTEAMGLDIEGDDATGLFELQTLQDLIDTFVSILTSD